MIFRNDDVTMATDFKQLAEIYRYLRQLDPHAEIWSCVGIFSKNNQLGAVYPDLPLGNKTTDYLLNVDQTWQHPTVNVCGTNIAKDLGRIVSHGLFHMKHSQLTYDAQKMSIVGSCNALGADIFVPPFSNFNEDTEQICKDHGVRMTKPSDGWKSLESEPFDPNHKLWFFHSWRYTPQEFKESIESGIPINEKNKVRVAG